MMWGKVCKVAQHRQKDVSDKCLRLISWSGPGDGPQGETKDREGILQAFGELESMTKS